MARVRAAKDERPALEESALAAALGGVPVPKLMLSGLFEGFERLSRPANRALSPDQMRK